MVAEVVTIQLMHQAKMRTQRGNANSAESKEQKEIILLNNESIAKMIGREKVIKGLECCSEKQNCKECPYFCFNAKCQDDMNRDALSLLKEQEAVEGHWIPIESPTGVEAFGIKEMTVQVVRCSVCNAEEDVSFATYRFCPRCGAKMEGR